MAMNRRIASTARVVLERSAGPAPERNSRLLTFRLAAFAVVVILASIGLAVLALDVNEWIALALPAVLGVLWLTWSVWSMLAIVPAIAVAILALVGFNALWHWVGFPRLEIFPGLLLAVAVFAVGTFLFMRTVSKARWALGTSAGLSLFVVIVLPWFVGWRTDDTVVPMGTPIVSKVDVLVVSTAGPQAEGETPTPPVPTGSSTALDVRYSVARVGPQGPAWTLVDSPDPVAADQALTGDGPGTDLEPSLRPDADQILLLIVDRADAPGLAFWRDVARQAVRPGVPIFALLPGQDKSRLPDWREAFQRDGGGAVTAGELGVRSPTQIGLTLAVSSPETDQELLLATRFRPLLLFDDEAALAAPVNIEGFFASGRVELCTEGLTGKSCESILKPSELVNGSSNLRLDLDGLADYASPTSTIYVHVVRGEGAAANLLYLDYWWYLPDNQVAIGDGVFCGAGMALSGVTCFDHESDWEGVTVVIDQSGGEPRPVAIHYAQHESVVAYAWEDLAAKWAEDSFGKFTTHVPDAAERPLVFVAEGSHASYPTPCPNGCRQITGLGEDPHDGMQPWTFNDTPACALAACVQPVPLRKGGSQPALWNAYTGQWGERDCLWKYFCTVGGAPSGPAQRHDRYDDPAACDQRRLPGGRRLGEGCS